MKKILFPTAYSLQSKVAFRYTQKLAQYFDASISLLHVYKTPSTFLAGEEEVVVEVQNEKYQELLDHQWEKELEKLREFALEMDAKQFRDIPLDFIATDGNIVEEILEVQKANDFDLIVMGMRQHTAVERLFGNTTYSVIDKINGPLLLIPPTAHYLGMDKIIYGTAFQIGDESAINHLFDWCEAFDAKLHLLHVHLKENSLLANHKMDELMKNYHAEYDAGIITYQLLEGKIKEAMELYVEFTGADMLAIHRGRKKGFWQRIQEGSLTKILADDSMVPLLVLK